MFVDSLNTKVTEQSLSTQWCVSVCVCVSCFVVAVVNVVDVDTDADVVDDDDSSARDNNDNVFVFAVAISIDDDKLSALSLIRVLLPLSLLCFLLCLNDVAWCAASGLAGQLDSCSLAS